MSIKAHSDMVTVDGAEIYYEWCGSGPVVLAIGGAGSGAISFTKIAPVLAEEFCFVSYDRRGTIRSTGRTGTDLDIAQQSDDVIAVLEAVGAASAVVFASCGGASIGFDIVARYPEYVDGLIAHEPMTINVLPDAAEELTLLRGLWETNEREGPVAAMVQWMEFVGRDFDLVIRETLRERAARDGDFIIRHEVMPMVMFMPDFEALGRTGVPLVMAAGEGSLSAGYGYARTVPILAERLNCKMAIFPGHHTSYVYRPEEFADAIRTTVHGLHTDNGVTLGGRRNGAR